jgi:hypothetical protein
VNSSGIVKWNIADLPFENAAEFFASYDVPRCSRDGKQCIKISTANETTYPEWDGVLLDVAGAADAAWVTDPDVDRSMYVLKACRAKP